MHAVARAGRITSRDLSLAEPTLADPCQALRKARQYGLIEPAGHKGRLTVWRLTPRGEGYVAGRIRFVNHRPGRREWIERCEHCGRP